jgi:hypothetical protein
MVNEIKNPAVKHKHNSLNTFTAELMRRCKKKGGCSVVLFNNAIEKVFCNYADFDDELANIKKGELIGFKNESRRWYLNGISLKSDCFDIIDFA